MLPTHQQFRLAAVANRHRANWTQENALLEEVIADIKYCYPEKFHTNSTLDERKFAGVPLGVKYGRTNRD
jgi:hypothetical protein